MIELERLEKIKEAPVHLISNSEGMVISNSQALATECIQLRAFVESYEPSKECLESKLSCDYRFGTEDKCPCQYWREAYLK